MKKVITIILITILSLSWYSCQQTKDSIIETALKEEARKFNQTGGRMLDEDIRVDSMAVAKGKVVTYYYTLVNYEKKDLDTNFVKKRLRPEMGRRLSTNKELKLARENKVTFRYYYYDKNGQYTFRLSFVPKDYIAK